MIFSQNRKILLDIILLGLLYAIIYTCLVYFVYPIEIGSGENVIARALGSAFYFGAFSGFFTGLIGGIWVNRLEFKSSITIGILIGLTSAILGSIIFPFIGSWLRIFYFGENPSDFIVEVYFLINYSIVGVAPGLFVGLIAGVIGGIFTGDIGTGVGPHKEADS